MKYLLDIPYYSQHLDIEDERWQSRACGIVCLKMVLDGYKKTDLSVDDLLNEAISRGAFGDSGWIHNIIVDMAKDLGFLSFRKEWKSEIESIEEILFFEATREFIENLLDGQPIIVSTVKNFSEADKFHQVLLTGFEENEDGLKGFYYHDPDSKHREDGKNKFVLLDTFKNNWRKMAIYVKI
ncbi:MAG: C39 family peptidase [Patescibacteria group bacterium]